MFCSNHITSSQHGTGLAGLVEAPLNDGLELRDRQALVVEVAIAHAQAPGLRVHVPSISPQQHAPGQFYAAGLGTKSQGALVIADVDICPARGARAGHHVIDSVDVVA
jgi:hypothetical protein